MAWLVLFCFAVWMWFEAITTPSERWGVVDWTKRRWFIIWYVSGLLTSGLVPMGMAIYFYRRLRPDLRAAAEAEKTGVVRTKARI
jgi:hypothetical protein